MFTSSSVRRARSVATELEVSPPFAACKRSWKPVFPLHGGASKNQSQYEEGSSCNESTPKKKGLLLVGGVFGAGIATVVVSAFTLFAGAGIAASKDKPHVVNPPVGHRYAAARQNADRRPRRLDEQPDRLRLRVAPLRQDRRQLCRDQRRARTKYTLTSGRRRKHVALPRDREELRRQQTKATSVPTAVIQKAAAPPTTPPRLERLPCR